MSLEGRLPFGEIPTYTADEVRQGIIPDIFDSYAVWMDGRHVQEQSLGRCYRGEFMDNDLVVAIAGTLEYLTPFFDRIASDLEASPDFPSYKTVDFSRPQGHIQRLYTNTDIPFNALLDDYPDGGFHGFDDHIVHSSVAGVNYRRRVDGLTVSTSLTYQRNIILIVEQLCDCTALAGNTINFIKSLPFVFS